MSLAAAFLLFFAVKNALYPPEGQESELWYLIFKTLPTIVTLFVQLLMMSANRYAFLLGGCNSVIYGIVYFMEGVPFSGISALVLSFLAKSYTDAPRYTSYIIMPMSFLCNTFFSTDQMPAGFRQVISLLPLSQASAMIRAISNGEAPGWFGFAVLLTYLVVFGVISVVFIYRKKNL